jgi:hypothetical protein
MWQAAQLALNTLAPRATSAARAGRARVKDRRAIATAINDQIFLMGILLIQTESAEHYIFLGREHPQVKRQTVEDQE